MNKKDTQKTTADHRKPNARFRRWITALLILAIGVALGAILPCHPSITYAGYAVLAILMLIAFLYLVIFNLHQDQLESQQRTEDVLNASELKFKTLYDFSADGILLRTVDRRIVSANPMAVRMLGYQDEAELKAVPLTSLYPEYQPDGELSAKKIDRLIEQFLREGNFLVEWRYQRKDGSCFDATLAANSLFLEGVQFQINTIHDITGQKSAEKALAVSETKYKALFDLSADAIMLRTIERKIICGNKAAIALFGCKDEAEFSALTPKDMYPKYQSNGQLSEKYSDIVKKNILREKTGYYEWRFRRKDGSEFDSTISFALLELEGEQVFISTIRDVTKQKKDEEALAASEAKYKALFESSTDAITLRDPDRHIVSANKAAVALFGYDNEQELMAVPPRLLYPQYQPNGELSEPRADELMKEAVRTGSAFLEWRYRRKDGSAFDATISIAAISVNQQLFILTTIRDITRFKVAEAALAASELKYKTLFNASADAIMLRTLDRRIVSVNKSAVAMFGCKDEDELINTPPQQLYPKIQPDGTASEIKAKEMIEILKDKGTHFFEWRYNRKNGEQFDAMVALTAMQLQGKSYLLTTVRDITEQRRAATAVKSSEAKYRTLFDASSDAILLRTPDRRIIGANRAAVALFGCKNEAELLTKKPEDIYVKYQSDGRLSSEKAPEMAEIALREGSYSFEWTYRRCDETEFLANVLWTRMEIEGKLILLTTIRDITEQRRAEEALKASERQLRLFNDNMTDVIWAIDFSGKIIYASPSVKQLLGYTPAEFTQLSIRDILTPESLAITQEKLARVVTDAKANQRVAGGIMEIEQVRKDGSTVVTEVSYGGMYDEAGQVVAVQGVTRDITARKIAEANLAKARDEAQAANRAKSAFLAMMSHEIRTPLNAIIGMTGLLLDTNLTHEQRDSSETIRTSSEILLTLINDILDFSKIEAERMDLEYQPFHIARCIREAVDLIAAKAAEKQLAVHLAISPELPAYFLGDAARLRQILVNLLSNSVKFTDHGEIGVSVSGEPSDGGYTLHFIVRDTGIGVPPEQHERLFRSFSQLDVSTSRRFGGSGLGLAISKRLCELMGGAMWVESSGTPGEGAAFHFTVQTTVAPDMEVPEQEPTHDQFALPGEIKPPLSTYPYRVLLAEDNPINQKVAIQMLAKLGCRADVAANGLEVLDAFRLVHYDVILMDCQMPEMDGYEATQRIREIERQEQRKPVHIIAMTANAMQGDRELCLAAGMNDYLGKPVRLHDLDHALEKYHNGTVNSACVPVISLPTEIPNDVTPRHGQ